MKLIWQYHFTPGPFTIVTDGAGITAIDYGKMECGPDAQEKETPLHRRAALELEEYFAGTRTKFDLPLSLHGTPFQLSVWKALQDIPYGETRSYGQIAAQIGNPKACRAVGMANHRNPIIIVVPCHRVIGQNGSLTGYGGGLELKELLLSLEKIHVR